MKHLPQFYQSNERTVDAYTHPELFDSGRINNLLQEARRIAYDEWESNGFDDRGSCVLGAGIEVWAVKPRARVARPVVVVRQVSQGNLSSAAAAEPAIQFLRQNGIDASWNDGRMD